MADSASSNRVYTTPKKIKHKRKKTKLAVLKYYKVDGDGKIERLRRECPAEQVGCLAPRLCAHLEWRMLTRLSHSAVPVSSWPPCRTASTAVAAT